jgi:hypothetical protein
MLIGVVMNKRIMALALVLVISFSIIVSGILFIHLGEGEESASKLYTFPLSVGDKTYVVTVRSNYSSAPKVYLPSPRQLCFS